MCSFSCPVSAADACHLFLHSVSGYFSSQITDSVSHGSLQSTGILSQILLLLQQMFRVFFTENARSRFYQCRAN